MGTGINMILIDFSQIVFSNLHQHMADSPVQDDDLLRHMIINSLRGYNKKYRRKYGDVVVGIDSRTYWRKSIFKYYKNKRAKQRDDNKKVDWEAFFRLFDEIKTDLREAAPYKFIEVEGAEGDDIIGVLTQKMHIHEPIMIVSSDEDFGQLHKYKGVEQFHPMKKKLIKVKDANAALKAKIIKGDKGDGIPNILSPSDSYYTGTRCKSIFTKKLDVWLGQEPSVFCESEEALARFKENEQLIDLTFIPDDVRIAITEAYEQPIKGTKMKLMAYFGKRKMRRMSDYIDDF